jgi:2-dehydropantoate 2-reductase
MRFLFIGAGVIGSLYAGRLALAGHEVELMARGRRRAALGQAGLVLVDEDSERFDIAPVRVVENGDSSAPYDFVMFAVRRDQLDEALVAASRFESARAFVTMVNLADGGEGAARVLGAERLVMGFPGAGGTVRDDGSVAYRIVSGAIQRTTFGEASGGTSARARVLARACAAAGFPSAVSRDMASWQRSHLALVSPIANAVYAAGGDIAACARDRRLMGLMVDAIREGFEVVRVARGLGVCAGRARGGRVEPPKLAVMMALPKAFLVPAFASRMASPWGETVIARHAIKARGEMRLLSEDLLGLADRAAQPTPALRELARLAETRYPGKEQ